METFDIKRFGLTLKWQFLSNYSKYLSILTGAFLVFVLIEVLLLLMGESPKGGDGGYKFVVLVYAFVGACLSFSKFKTKQKRLTLLTHPSSNMEKFLSIYISYVVVWIIGVLLAFMLADTLRVLIAPLFVKGTQLSGIPCLFTGDWYDASFNGKNMLTGFTQFLTIAWIQSWFLLGGLFFRRHATLLSALSMFILSFMIFGVYVVMYGNIENVIMSVLDESKMIITEIIDVVLIAFDYVASYWLFKRMQVINNRWINI